MDTKASGLVLVLYLLLAMIVAVAAYSSYSMYRQTHGGSAVATARQQPSPPAADLLPSRAAIDIQLSQRRHVFEDAVRKINRLEELLDQKTELLKKKDALLAKKSAECEALKTESNHYLTLMIETLLQDISEVAVEPEEEGQGTGAVVLRKLRDQLAQAELAERTREAELATVQKELDRAYAELAERQVASLLDQEQTIQLQAEQVLVRIGTEAVPALVASLSDQRAQVRSWAAALLGRIGPDAGEAIPALTEAAQDDDPRVRTAALAALRRIDRAN